MSQPGFTVVPDNLVQYSQTVAAIESATNDAAQVADTTGFGGIDVYGLLASPIVLPLLYLCFHSTRDSIKAAADLGGRIVTSLESTIATYSGAEADLLNKLLALKEQQTDAQMTALTAERESHPWSGGDNTDDIYSFGDDIYQRTQNHGTDAGLVLDVVGLGVDALGAVVDPWGALFSVGVGWLIEQIPILRVPVDDLLGDPEAIKAVAATWAGLGGWLGAIPDQLSQALPVISSWQGPAADTYRGLEAQYETAFNGLRDQCLGVANMVTFIGAIVGQVRSTAVGMIADLVAWVVATIVAALGLSECTFGASLGAANLAIAIEGEVQGIKLELLIAQLLVKIAQCGTALETADETAQMSAGQLNQVITGSN